MKKRLETGSMNTTQRRAYKLLPKGPHEPIMADVMAQALGVSYRDCMSVISELISVHKIPIVGRREKPFGFYIARNEKEAYEGTKALYNQSEEMARRVDTVRKADFSRLDKIDQEIFDHRA